MAKKMTRNQAEKKFLTLFMRNTTAKQMRDAFLNNARKFVDSVPDDILLELLEIEANNAKRKAKASKKAR